MPPVQHIAGHAYVSLRDIVADFLLHADTKVDPIPSLDGLDNDETTLARCRQAKLQRRRYDEQSQDKKEVVHVAIVEWSDDFEGNNSIKSDRSSIWIKTVTMICEKGKDSADGTYIVALGEKSANHEPVEAAFATTLMELSDNTAPVEFLFGSDKLVHRVAVHLVASLADQPERRSANHIRGGNSACLRRWGWRTSIDTLQYHLPACPLCVEKNMTAGDIHTHSNRYTHKCVECLNWGFHTGNEDQVNGPYNYYKYPQHFPTDEPLEDDSGYTGIKCAPLTYTMLSNHVNKAYLRVSEGQWDHKTGRSFLSAMGIDQQYGDLVLRNAENVHFLRVAQAAKEDEPEDYQVMLTQKQSHPDQFVQPPLPPLWTRQQDLRQHVDCPMHLLFLGVVRKILKIQAEWASARKVLPHFVKLATAALEDVAKLQLTWCTVLPLSVGTYGGWVSENYVGASRIMLWYSTFLLMTPVDESPDLPDPEGKPDDLMSPWRTAQCNQWYITHRIPVSERRRLVRDKQQHIRQLMESDDCPSRRAQAPKMSLLLLLSRLTYMLIATFMASAAGDRQDANQQLIRAFLTVCVQYDRCWQAYQDIGNKYVPFWISCYNFCSLLNLPDIIEHYGSLRLLWEGGFQGEKVLTHIKPLVTRGSARGFQDGIVRSFHMQKVLTRFNRRFGARVIEEEKQQYGKVYGGVGEIRQCMIARKPIVVVWYEGGPVGCVVQGCRTNMETQLQLVNLTVILHFGWWTLNGATYWRWRYPTEQDVRPLPRSAVVRETIFLPFLFDSVSDDLVVRGVLTEEQTQGAKETYKSGLVLDDDSSLGMERDSRGYYTISSEWEELGRAFQFVVPAIDASVTAAFRNSA